MTRFTATISTGRVISRNSKRTYTHCAALVQDGSCILSSWAGSRALAEKAANSAEFRSYIRNGWVVEILPVAQA